MDAKHKPLVDNDLKWPARKSVASGHKAARQFATMRPDVARKASGHKKPLLYRGFSVVTMRPDRNKE